MKRIALGLASAMLSLNISAKDASITSENIKPHSSQITTIAVDIRALQEFTATTFFQATWAGIQKPLWLKDMTPALARDITKSVWDNLRAGNGFGSEEYYINLAEKHGDTALAELIAEMVNKLSTNSPLLNRLRILRGMGYRIIVCSPTGESVFNAVRYDAQVHPQLYTFLSTVCNGKPELTEYNDDKLTPATIEHFLANNGLIANQVLFITDNATLATQAEKYGATVLRVNGHSDEDVILLEAKIARTLGCEKQFGAL